MSSVLDFVKELVDRLGLTGPTGEVVARSAIVAAVVVVALASNWLAKRVVIRGITKLAGKSRTKWDDILLEAKFFSRLALLAPALVVYSFIPVMFDGLATGDIGIRLIIERVCLAFMILVGTLAVTALLDGLVNVYRTFEVSKQRPITSYVQIVKIFGYVVGGILMIGALLDEPVWPLLASLGTMTALILLVFKDSILGLVASVHLTSNNLVRIGDWIEMPRYKADGEVLEVSLNTVRVRNWDMTISTIPTYSLMSDSFKNWRGMSDSGGRRIKRSLNIDMNSVRFCDEPMVNRFRKFTALREYVEEKEKEIERYNDEQGVDTSVAANGRRLTNLGTFRRYVQAYLENHSKIHRGMTLLVRQLQPTVNGIPIEIYAFSNDQAWSNYEAIQADIFDHLLAVVHDFDLRVFQTPSGADLRSALREG